MNTQSVFELLIVEDDRIIREGLASAPVWGKLGFHVVTAADAQEALLLAAQGVDVVLTDIKMPGMNGLELIERLRQTQPELPCVILSGYSEFEYARRAVRLNVVEYLTKPVDPEQLEKLFSDIAHRLSTRKEQGRAAQASLTSFVYALLECSMPQEHLNARLQMLGLSADEGSFQLLWLDGAEDTPALVQKEPFASAWLHFPFHDGYLFVLRKPVETSAVQAALPQGVRAAISACAPGLHQLHLRRAECEAALDRMFFTGETAAQYAPGTPPSAEPLPAAIPALSQQIASAYAKLEEQQMEQLLQELVQLIARHASTAAQARSTLHHLGATLYGLDNLPYTRAQELQQAQTLHSAQQALWSHMQQLLQSKRAAMSGGSSISQRAMAYIARHLSEKLSLEDIASALYVNPSYLSRVFKKETGLNIGSYVNAQKIEKAKEYMRRMDVGICDVSLELGFTDYSYFCVLFKKHTGETPLGYRKRILYGTEKKK